MSEPTEEECIQLQQARMFSKLCIDAGETNVQMKCHAHLHHYGVKVGDLTISFEPDGITIEKCNNLWIEEYDKFRAMLSKCLKEYPHPGGPES